MFDAVGSRAPDFILAVIAGPPVGLQPERRLELQPNWHTSTHRTSGFRGSDVDTANRKQHTLGHHKETLLAQHVLLTYATRRPYSSNPPLPEGSRYDVARGYWVHGDSPLADGDESPQVTKKCDQETGEDQKGE